MAIASGPALRLESAPREGGRPASFWRFEGSPPPGSGRTPILAVAGLGLDGRVFDRLGDLARDRDLVLANLPNEMPRDATMADFGREALSILDAAGHAGRPAVLVGSSFGGMVALAAAAAAPGRAAALVLLGAAPGWSGVPLHLRAAALFHPVVPRAIYPRVLATVMVPPGGGTSPEVRAALRTQMLHRDKRFVGASLSALRGFDGNAALAGYRGPALVLHGERDPVFGPAIGRSMAETLPHAEFVPFPDTGHLPHVSRPERIVDSVRRWLDREGL